MSYLSELIEKFCGDGVEWREIGEVCEIRNGYTPSKSNKEYWENGEICWFRLEDIRQNGGILNDSIQKVNEIGVKGNLFPRDSIIVSTTATIGIHALITTEFICNQQMSVVSVKSENKKFINIKFLFYYFYLIDVKLEDLKNSRAGLSMVSLGKLRKLKIPIPPLEVQKEIVRILDKFTNLIYELTRELTLRKKQYEYYRNKLLTFQK